ncbi:MAG: 50S ribosomal protein L7 [Ruminococcaceae bacterium]|nr:50S ribosomal protein L7 [Oscillospiraceae bacterium]
MEHILSMIGLAKKAGLVEIGEEPVGAAARAKHARVILVAEDAGASSVRRAYSFAQSGACLCLTVSANKDDLGRALGRTSCAMAAVTDIGFAESIVKKLAVLDEARYGAAAAQLSVKAKRAAERKREQLQHEKNVQQGKKKRKAEPPAAPAPKAEQSAAPKKSAPRKNTVRKNTAPSPADRFAGSRPVKKGKGSIKKK